MKAIELRIGNYIDVATQNVATITYFQNSTVQEIGDQYVKLQNKLIPYENITAIPLTEEWLLRFGFVNYQRKEFHYSVELIANAMGYESNDINFVIDPLTKHIKIEQTSVDSDDEGYFEGKIYPVYPKYVHQLQNLVFALTGEELTIKEPTL